jgi:hypothetical protein
MKRQELKWCGEGDLFSRPLLKTRKLYTSRSSQSSQSATNTKSSHTVSHTAVFGGLERLCNAAIVAAEIQSPEAP